MTDDQKSLAAELDRLAAEHARLAADAADLAIRVRQRESEGGVVARILRGDLLNLEQAADIAECSDEKIRKQCELTAGTKRPLGIKFAGRWMVGKSELIDDLEQGKIDKRRGPLVRQRAEERARKYEGWARPQEPLKLAERADRHCSEAPPDAA
ncbi:hypothetical protein [Bradyrhizobium sp. Ash2021]|uniref:hypothetical protein n=1 Tax=Bradyrhizobium sp. Ash2021 TaxID=2954771 RepID=UPI0028155036|nr:hypothetical protein [Bradyrhizobium sp. Ash2021]WMT71901.1 hypothetical protein NL528_27965 [Bradyrhizobium sp. Ash2021]